MSFFQRLLAKLRTLFTGRYGMDGLSIALTLTSCFLLLVLGFIPKIGVWRMLISYVPLILVLLRMFSKNFPKRRQENEKFMKIWNPIAQWCKNKFFILKTSKDFIYFKCPQCKKQLRVPRHKGEMSVTCPVCKTKFDKKI